MGLFVVYGARDLPSPWSAIVAVTGAALIWAYVYLSERRAPVRRKLTLAEIVLYLVAASVLLAGGAACALVTHRLDLPLPNIVAAGGLALASVPMGLGFRRIYERFVRHSPAR